MKTLPALVSLALLFGCSQQTKETAADITGIDGFRIGDKLAAQFKTDIDARGQLYYFDNSFSGVPPFRFLSITLTKTREIAFITLTDLDSANTRESYSDALRILKTKYGEPHYEPNGEGTEAVWDHGRRSLRLIRQDKHVDIEFIDHELVNTAEAQRESAAKEKLSGLIK